MDRVVFRGDVVCDKLLTPLDQSKVRSLKSNRLLQCLYFYLYFYHRTSTNVLDQFLHICILTAK